MITTHEAFWQPIGWQGWVQFIAGDTMKINHIKHWDFMAVSWVYVRKTGHNFYKPIAGLSVKIWVDDWRCVYGPDKLPCMKCNKLEDCIYSKPIDDGN